MEKDAFLYIDPIKQGLKRMEAENLIQTAAEFLYIDPIKQGLKHKMTRALNELNDVFIHRSNKTRIET